MSKAITKKYLINGPFNVVRLTNDKNKILYIFGDVHNNIDNQTECKYNNDHDSIDVDKFFLLFMKKNKEKKFDLFLETSNTNFVPSIQNNYKEIYIHSILKLFKYYLIKDKRDIRINTKYPNFRFHYSDNRNKLLNYYDMFYFYDNNIKDKILSSLNIPVIYKFLKELVIEFNESLNTNYSINKILTVYKDKDIEIIINNIYKEIVNTNIDNLLSIIDKLIINYSDFTESIIKSYINKIHDLCADIGVVITDLFFIRRFLDKNYINNCILYTGNYHLINIMYLLVKYFKFTITHVYDYSNVKKLNKYLLNLSSKNLLYINNINEEFENFVYRYPLLQCSNLLDFPDNFN